MGDEPHLPDATDTTTGERPPASRLVTGPRPPASRPAIGPVLGHTGNSDSPAANLVAANLVAANLVATETETG